MPSIRMSLVKAVLNERSDSPATRRVKARVFHGAKPALQRDDAAGDALILEIRRLYEQCGLSPKKIHTAMASAGLSKTYSWVYQTTQYNNRAHLIPTSGAACYLPESIL